MSISQADASARARQAACGALGLLFLFMSGCAHPRPTSPPTMEPSRGGRSFTATAYCAGRLTATGARPTNRTVAADPAVLAMGTRIRIFGLGKPYDGMYTVDDTGACIRGRRLDLYIRDCHEAVRFG